MKFKISSLLPFCTLLLLGGCSHAEGIVTIWVSTWFEFDAAEDGSCGVGDWWDITKDGVCTEEDNAGLWAELPSGTIAVSSAYVVTYPGEGIVGAVGDPLGSGYLQISLTQEDISKYPFEKDGLLYEGVTWIDVEARDPTLTHPLHEFDDPAGEPIVPQWDAFVASHPDTAQLQVELHDGWVRLYIEGSGVYDADQEEGK
ncbi:hypothetical protein ACFL2M_00825 [Patescibacteria group bacterium]